MREIIPYLERITENMTSANARQDSDAPASNTQATATIAAPGDGKALRIETVTVSLQAPALSLATGVAELTDGSAVYWTAKLLAVAGGIQTLALPIRHTLPANTQAILRFTSASGTGSEQVVSITGSVISA